MTAPSATGHAGRGPAPKWVIHRLPLGGPIFLGAMAAYGAAFAGPPYNDGTRALEVRERLHGEHSRRPGLRGYCAVLPGDEVAGMTYGFRSLRGQAWHEAVAQEIGFGPSRTWLSNAYELAELAVAPAYQGFGIGSALIASLLKGRSERTCVLSTRADSDAHILYARLGFETLCKMPFRAGGAPFLVMGKVLP